VLQRFQHTFRTKVATPPSLQGLPIGQQHYDPMYRAMEHQRNREYNDFLQKVQHVDAQLLLGIIGDFDITAPFLFS
jgi:hypothetical protein